MPVEVEAYGLPFEEAIAFLRQKTRFPTQTWRDLEGQAHDHAFAVAGAMRMDLLADLKAAVEAALADGETLQDFRRRFDEIVQRYGWDYKGSRGWRTRTIYTTNLRTAYAAGRQAQQRHPKVTEKRPYWWYRHGGSMEPRKQHVSPPPHGFNGLVLRHDHPFWQTHYPPNGWGCSCKVFTLSAEDAKARGLTISEEAPDLGTYEEVDRKTGEVVELPVGVGLGWDHAPGASWLRHLTPEWLDGWPRQATRLPAGQGLDPLPPPRRLPASTLMPEGLPDEHYARQFLRAFGADLGRSTTFEDAAGDTLLISENLFKTRSGGHWKIKKRGRERYVRVLAEALRNPDEIWVALEPLSRDPGRYGLFRRYVARFEIPGEDGSAFALFEWGPDGWLGITTFQADDVRYLEGERVGLRLYRRNP